MVLQRLNMEIQFSGRDHNEIVEFDEKISVRDALLRANIQPSTVIVSIGEDIIPHAAIIKSNVELKVITVSSGG